jgi:uncharacterized protein with FMN-binding domain
MSRVFLIAALILTGPARMTSPQRSFDPLMPAGSARHGTETKSIRCVSAGADSLRPVSDKSAVAPAPPKPLRDGRYTAESPGWTGMCVEVEVRDSRLCAVRVLKVKGSSKFYGKVVSTLPKRMEDKAGIDVDDVTGATLSSRSLKQAVRLALEKARASVD